MNISFFATKLDTVLYNMSEDLETISNPSVDSLLPRPLGTDTVEETNPKTTQNEHEQVSNKYQN